MVFEIGLPTNFLSLQSNFDFDKSKNVREFSSFCITNIEVDQKLKEVFFDCEISLYSSSTAIFAPDFIADIRLGVFTKLSLSINQISCYIINNVGFCLTKVI